MNQHQLHDTEALSAERISDEEARQIVELWSHGQTEKRRELAQTTVSDMAEGLDSTPDEILRLLHAVRSRQATPCVQQRRSSRGALALAAIVALLLVWVFLRLAVAHFASPAATVVAGETEHATREVAGPGVRYQRRADGSVVLDTPEGHYERGADGSLVVTSPQGRYERGADGSVEIRGSDGYYLRRADGSEERSGTPPRIVAPPPPPGVSLPDVPSAAP